MNRSAWGGTGFSGGSSAVFLSRFQAVIAFSQRAKSGPKKVTVSVTYDESGRVTQASGGDASAVRIARQKRFPAGKAGSATITIPIN
jgi:predicted NAD/FAD-binding protein